MREIVKGVRREMRKRVETQDGLGFTTIPDGFEEADIEVVVDVAGLARSLGVRAMGNKSGRARFLHGNIIVNVVRRERVGRRA